MKTYFRFLLAFVFASAAFADEPELTPIDLSKLAADKAHASETAYDNRRTAIRAFDGSGLSADGKHGITANDTMYMMKNNNTGDFPWCIQVDLGEVKNLGAARIWNFNFASGSTKYTMRGIKNYKIYVSKMPTRKTTAAEVVANYTLVTSGTLKEASGTANEEGELIVFEKPVGARHFALVAEDDFDEALTKLNYCGVAEIKLFTAPGEPDPEPEREPVTEIIVDNADASGVETHGTWKTSTSSTHRIGSNYLHNSGKSSADNWVKFTPAIETNATYKVSLYWNATIKTGEQYDMSRGVNVPIEIGYDGGTVTNIVDMSVQHTDWYELGNWPFKVGETGFVRILTQDVVGRDPSKTDLVPNVIADAVKFAVTEDAITEPDPEPGPEPEPEPEPDPTVGEPQLSICCVGDSITEGANSATAANKWTYRLYLPDLLKAQGLTNIAWKGSHVSSFSGSSLPSEGWCGNSAAEIANKYVTNAAKDKADILLLHAGHNYDASNEADIPSVVAAITNAHARIITAARAHNPRVIILEAKVITSGKLPKYQYIPTLNEAIGALASEFDTPISPVHAVDMADGWNFEQYCINDKVHPTEAGARRMAETWCAAIFAALPETGTDRFFEAEAFVEKGGWVVDPQFVEQMGSPYLLAHGRGIPVADATTKVGFRAAGHVRAWVRTRDWTPDWDGEKPGRFQLVLGGITFPNALGVSPATWGWVDAGTVEVGPGLLTLALKDLTGFEGRCDAIFLTDETSAMPPPNGKAELAAWRAQRLGESEAPTDVVETDLVVVGGGIAGTAAAIAAAEAGLSVALVQDRPMLGGNASDEIRVKTEKAGDEGHWIVKAIRNTDSNGKSMAKDDTARMNLVASYPKLSTHCSWRAYGVVTNTARRIVAVDARHIVTGARRRFAAQFFCDATGDGWIGYWAGASYMLGREAKTTFDEPQYGQDKADTSTMGNSLLWTTKQGAEDYTFPSVPWATKVSGARADTAGGWEWEAGLDPKEDTIDDAEMLRDRLFRAAYGSFSNTKAKAGNEKLVFNFLGYIAGKRESRRLVGGYVVSEKDVTEHKPFEDAIGIATWSIDLHRMNGTSGFLATTTHHQVGAWWMPYRSLYSKDVPNLFMAGRCASYSHVAFGSSRVMHAGGQQGVAVGYAAALCKEYGCAPQAIYASRSRFNELRTLINAKQGEKEMVDYAWPEPVMEKEVVAVVKDNDDAEGVEIKGDWVTSTSSTDRIGKDYLHNNKIRSEDMWIRYTPDLPRDGTYTVSLMWNGNDTRSKTVPVEIVYDGGVTTNSFDMAYNPQKWVAVGAWPFKKGTAGSVRILTTTEETDKWVIADAVKFAITEKKSIDSRGGKITIR